MKLLNIVGSHIRCLVHTTRFQRAGAILALTLAALTSGGCDEEFARRGVTVEYTQTHQCGSLIVAGSPTTPGPVTYQAGPFIVYTVTSIENQKPEARDVGFQTDRLYAHPSLQSRPVSPWNGGTITVPAGTTWNTGGRVVIRLNPPGTPAPGASGGLVYDPRPGGPPVALLHRRRAEGVLVRNTCSRDDLLAVPALR